MKAQLNLRKGSGKDGFRILQRFQNIKDARKYLVEFIEKHPMYKATNDEDVFYDENSHTQIWISRQFTPTGNYFYPHKTNSFEFPSN